MKKHIAIIGGGASALFLACELDPDKFEVSVFEKNATLGRKFLVAGDGGLNYTHSEATDSFIKRYSPTGFLNSALHAVPNTKFIEWMQKLGIHSYVGSSKRLFPQKGLKPVQVLNKIKSKIRSNHVQIHVKHQWLGFSDANKLIFKSPKALTEVEADYVVFCLGGASWKVTGSDGVWTEYFIKKKISLVPFQPSNCAFQINWKKEIISKIEAQTLKNCAFTCNSVTHLGEAVLTRFGIEGSGVYPLSEQIRYELANHGSANLYVDFKPGQSLDMLSQKLNTDVEKKNLTQRLKDNLKLNPAQITLIKSQLSKEDYLNQEMLTSTIKRIKIQISGLAPIDEAISTVGGIDLKEINENFELKKMPHHFVIGEMLDYDAPTGGYLLQSCFSMACYLANALNSRKSDTIQNS